MAAKSKPSRERHDLQDPRATVKEVHKLLDELFTTPDKVAFTNDSVRNLLYGLWHRLDSGLADYPAERVFSKAHNQVRVVRKNVWKVAQTEVLVRNGQPLPLMTEDKASKVLDPKVCPPKPKW